MATSIDTKGQGSSLVALPQEILIAIAENLADKDHSALTKTCRYMAVVLQESLFQRTNAGTYKAMDYASKRPDKDLITERALLYGFPPTIDTILGHGKTALGVAAFRGCREAVQALIKQGADVNAQGKQAIPPLGHAIHAFKLALGRARKFRTVDLNSYVGVISDLLDAGADPNCEILQPPGYNPVTVHPLQQVHDVTCRTSERTSQREVFRVKGWRGWEERVIKLLLQKGANPNLTGHYSLLSWFVERQEINYVLLFLAHGADPNLVDGDTAHPLAGCFLLNCRTNFPTLLADLIEPVALLMMHELLRRGANPMCDVGLPGRCRPLSMLASDSVLRPAPPGLLRAIDMLIEAGADVNHADRDATDSVTTNFGDWAPKTPVLTALMGPMVRSTESARLAKLDLKFLHCLIMINVMGGDPSLATEDSNLAEPKLIKLKARFEDQNLAANLEKLDQLGQDMPWSNPVIPKLLKAGAIVSQDDMDRAAALLRRVGL